jgi:hypothetical protein
MPPERLSSSDPIICVTLPGEIGPKTVSSRPAKFTQAEVRRLFAAAAEVGINVRLEIRPDGTLIATCGCKTTEVPPKYADTELDTWMKKHHADPA